MSGSTLYTPFAPLYEWYRPFISGTPVALRRLPLPLRFLHGGSPLCGGASRLKVEDLALLRVEFLLGEDAVVQQLLELA